MKSFLRISLFFLLGICLSFYILSLKEKSLEGCFNDDCFKEDAIEIKRVLEASYENKIKVMEKGLFLLASMERGGKIEWSECLYTAATKKAKVLSSGEYWGHKNPATGINESWEWIYQSCGKKDIVGENLTKNLYEPNLAHKMLMESDSHRKNILEVDFIEMGVSCDKSVCVELFSN